MNTSYHPKTLSRLLFTLILQKTELQRWMWFCDIPRIICQWSLEEKNIQQQPPNSSSLDRWMKAVDVWMNSLHQGTLSWKSSKQPMLLMDIKSKDENRELQNIINFLPGRLKLAMVSNRELWNMSSSLERDQQWNILAPSNKPPSTGFWSISTVKTMGEPNTRLKSWPLTEIHAVAVPPAG